MNVDRTKQRIAFVATVFSHFAEFHLPCMKLLIEQGYEVHAIGKNDSQKERLLAANIICHEVDFRRMPFHWRNIQAFWRLVVYFKKQKFRMAHVHTPVGGILGRLAAKLTRVPIILYTSHGFHFSKNGPLGHWLIFYPIEKIMACITDGIITINEEDYQIALRFKRNKTAIYLVNGMGVDLKAFMPMDKTRACELKKLFHIDSAAKVIVTVAECNKNKNQLQVIRSLLYLIKKWPNIHYLLIGAGYNPELLEEINGLNLNSHVQILGYRRDIADLLNIADLFILTSKREGLGIASIEAMAKGLPVIMTDTVGGRCLIEDRINGFLVPIDDDKKTAEAISSIFEDPFLYNTIYHNNLQKAQKYAEANVTEVFKKIYKTFLITAPTEQ